MKKSQKPKENITIKSIEKLLKSQTTHLGSLLDTRISKTEKKFDTLLIQQTQVILTAVDQRMEAVKESLRSDFNNVRAEILKLT